MAEPSNGPDREESCSKPHQAPTESGGNKTVREVYRGNLIELASLTDAVTGID
jgi:hypothetical protein